MCVFSPQEKWSVLVRVRRQGAWPLSLPSSLAQRFSVYSTYEENWISSGQRTDCAGVRAPVSAPAHWRGCGWVSQQALPHVSAVCWLWWGVPAMALEKKRPFCSPKSSAITWVQDKASGWPSCLEEKGRALGQLLCRWGMLKLGGGCESCSLSVQFIPVSTAGSWRASMLGPLSQGRGVLRAEQQGGCLREYLLATGAQVCTHARCCGWPQCGWWPGGGGGLCYTSAGVGLVEALKMVTEGNDESGLCHTNSDVYESALCMRKGVQGSCHLPATVLLCVRTGWTSFMLIPSTSLLCVLLNLFLGGCDAWRGDKTIPGWMQMIFWLFLSSLKQTYF